MKKKIVRVGVGVLINKDNKILLMKRINSHGSGTWAPPGGHLEFGESPEECAIRECEEETSLKITNCKFLGITNDFFEEKKHYITIWMEADYLSGTAVVNAKDELSELGWFHINNFPTPLFLPVKHFLAGEIYKSKLT